MWGGGLLVVMEINQPLVGQGDVGGGLLVVMEINQPLVGARGVWGVGY